MSDSKSSDAFGIFDCSFNSVDSKESFCDELQFEWQNSITWPVLAKVLLWQRCRSSNQRLKCTSCTFCHGRILCMLFHNLKERKTC